MSVSGVFPNLPPATALRTPGRSRNERGALKQPGDDHTSNGVGYDNCSQD